MGGNAFAGKNSRIARVNVQSTLDHLFKNVLRPAGILSYVTVGSAGKVPSSGDIDIVITPRPESDTGVTKDELVKIVAGSIGGQRVKKVGSSVSILYPIVSGERLTSDNVQIDVFISDRPEDVSWLMRGSAEGEVKGVYRNLLLSFIAAVRSEEMTQATGVKTKIAVSFPGGLTITKDGKKAVSSNSSPSSILNVLGLKGAPDALSTFEDLLSAARKDPVISACLEKFPEYISKYETQDPAGYSQVISLLTP